MAKVKLIQVSVFLEWDSDRYESRTTYYSDTTVNNSQDNGNDIMIKEMVISALAT